MYENENIETVTYDTASSGTADTYGNDEFTAVDVSAGDIYVTVPVVSALSDQEALAVYTVSGNDVSNDVLYAIDNNLSCIIFLILFIWSSRHIRNAVRSFTGRSVNK